MLAPAPDQLRHRVFRGSWAVERGVLTRGQLRGPTWQRLFPDVYVHRGVPVTELTRLPDAHPVRVPGLCVRRALLPDEVTCSRRGVLTTTPVWTALSLAARLPDDEG